jgi:hypothetical protein
LTSSNTCWHLVVSMSITVQLDLSESVAAAARAKGLLDPQKLTRLVEREVELDQPMRDFREMVEEMRTYPDEPMTMDEIQAVVNEVRTERRARRESGR